MRENLQDEDEEHHASLSQFFFQHLIKELIKNDTNERAILKDWQKFRRPQRNNIYAPKRAAILRSPGLNRSFPAPESV